MNLQSLKKIELHVHLEGSIPIPALWQLVQKYKRTDLVGSLEELHKKFEFTDFLHFLQTWMWKNQFLLELEDFTFIATEVAKDMAAQNIIYSEMFFSPGECESRGLDPRDLAMAIRKGFAKVPQIKINLIADLIRNLGPENGRRYLHLLKEVQDQGVIGIGIGGNERDFPAKVYHQVFEEARSFGFRTSAHAGEAAGAESIWQAIRDLKVDRIGHAMRIFEDQRLVEYVAEHKIGLEMCPISNMKTKVFDSQGGVPHPIKKLYDLGCLVTVNTDDPKMFHNNLQMEYEYLLSIGFQFEDLHQLNSNSVNVAWCDENEKKILKNQLNPSFGK